jgi:hypothetical protein
MSTSPLPAVWRGLVDDAAIFPPGNAPIHDALAAHAAHRDGRYADLVGPFVLRDTDVPLARGALAVLAIVVTGGAGQVAGPLGLCRRLGLEAAALEIALRDPGDLVGNARRVVAAVDSARAEGVLDDRTQVFVELPQADLSPSWLAAADVVAEAELRLKFRTGGVEAHLFPAAPTLSGWIDAALDRETPFKCTAGLHNAVRHTASDTGFEHHGFLNVLLATRAGFDGATADEVVEVLEERDGQALVTLFNGHGDDVMTGARRWFTSYGSCSVTEPIHDLIELGLLDD